MGAEPIIDTLPVKLSDLLAVALRDMQEAELRENVKIDMSVWLELEDLGDAADDGRDVQHCCVCMAGACLLALTGWDSARFEGKCSSGVYDGAPNTLKAKMAAINQLRQGHVLSAYQQMSQQFPVEYPDVHGVPELWNKLWQLGQEHPVVPYEIAPQEFFEDMRALLKTLRELQM